uniref:C-type lectin domain-containing protein n=1 Tax=Periophthalmus magnuspinnatus TaxID=409849 RepID=A0A3B3Z751_9GOBI
MPGVMGSALSCTINNSQSHCGNYIVQFGLPESPPPTPAPGSGKCLHGFEPYGRYCYFVYNGPKGYSWPDSRHYCQAIKGDLVSLHSRADVEFVRNLNYTKEHNIWIGLTRDQNFGWAWTDKTSVGFFNWAQNEPNDAFHPGEVAEENCVEMYPDVTTSRAFTEHQIKGRPLRPPCASAVLLL